MDDKEEEAIAVATFQFRIWKLYQSYQALLWHLNSGENLQKVTTSSSSLPQVCDESTAWPWPLTPCTWCLYQKRHQRNQNFSHFSNLLIGEPSMDGCSTVVGIGNLRVGKYRNSWLCVIIYWHHAPGGIPIRRANSRGAQIQLGFCLSWQFICLQDLSVCLIQSYRCTYV